VYSPEKWVFGVLRVKAGRIKSISYATGQTSLPTTRTSVGVGTQRRRSIQAHYRGISPEELVATMNRYRAQAVQHSA
jgi:hypothetical protein